MREFIEAFSDAHRECFGVWCELFDRRGTVDPGPVVASQQRVHEAAARLRSWCANPDLRKVAELERVELLRAQRSSRGRLSRQRIAAQRRKAQPDPIRAAWNERRAWLYGATRCRSRWDGRTAASP